VRVHWTDTAIEHLEAIHAYIAKTSPDYALRVVDRLSRRSQQIAEFPQSGRPVPEFELGQIREVLEGPYRIITTSSRTKSTSWQLSTPRNRRSERCWGHWRRFWLAGLSSASFPVCTA